MHGFSPGYRNNQPISDNALNSISFKHTFEANNQDLISRTNTNDAMTSLTNA